jgi:ATP-binding cassette, subfamily D (ALD), member 3
MVNWSSLLSAGQEFISTSSGKKIIGGGILATFAAKYVYDKFLRKKGMKRSHSQHILHVAQKKKDRVKIDSKFFARLNQLLKIAVPGWQSKEAFYLVTLLGFLVCRTFLSIKISEVNGSIVRAIVERNFMQFIRRIGILASIAIPASSVNSMLKYLGSLAALRFRSRLVEHMHERYFKPMMYYKVINIDNRISNPDQALTETLDLWGKSLSELYSNVTKPLLDIVLFSMKLSELVGVQGPASVIVYYIISGFLIRAISPAFGRLTAKAQRMEGEFRYSHNRLIMYSEEIAFYQGHDREKDIINERFQDVVTHMEDLYGKSLFQGVFDGFLVKYGSVMMGYAVLGLPVFGPGSEEYLAKVSSDPSQITHDYIRNSSLLINLARAIGRIVVSYKELQKLAGYTSLVSQLQDVLGDLEDGTYTRQMVSGDRKLPVGYKPNGGTFKRGAEMIRFEDVPVVTPNGDLLTDKVSFSIPTGHNIMIVGPNGCGKSSLFRILGELWPLFGGTLHKPDFGAMFYIPQKPYLVMGTFRDQIIYPHTADQATCSDEKLDELMAIVGLLDVKARVGGYDIEAEWSDTLSGGEKQRVAMARLFYHCPRYAILDECTSAVSVDGEATLYNTCKDRGITLITVSHRPSLWKYHDYKLEFDGRGSFSFGKMIMPDDFDDTP